MEPPTERRRVERPYELVLDQVSTNTVEALEYLLEGAKRGEVVGLAYAVIIKGRRFAVDCAGEACSNPLLARAVVAVLDDHLSDMIRGRTDRLSTI